MHKTEFLHSTKAVLTPLRLKSSLQIDEQHPLLHVFTKPYDTFSITSDDHMTCPSGDAMPAGSTSLEQMHLAFTTGFHSTAVHRPSVKLTSYCSSTAHRFYLPNDITRPMCTVYVRTFHLRRNETMSAEVDTWGRGRSMDQSHFSLQTMFGADTWACYTKLCLFT